MKLTPRYSDERGHVDHGWLTSAHSFSFGDYYDERHMGFGKLRVLNDDHIEGGAGFPAHPHRDMEIFTIPLLGRLRHMDSTGTESSIGRGDVQIMSAGTGVVHSEVNDSPDDPLELLQIWITPNKERLPPRYEERHFPYYEERNRLHLIISPTGQAGSLTIFQNAYVSIGVYDTESLVTYDLFDKENGLYLFVIEGEATVGGVHLKKRDALTMLDVPSSTIEVKERTTLLLIEVSVSEA